MRGSRLAACVAFSQPHAGSEKGPRPPYHLGEGPLALRSLPQRGGPASLDIEINRASGAG